ncbi:hypothetical protein BKA65DRAFT_9914 [Rhexocercosporidium sp. MPI-PUGE-AT-0058]|nr:hypothetical protein BKA65DRAFT_9914 [Rhexocercosporidium sp. MPI-PUGE-AT-0058]
MPGARRRHHQKSRGGCMTCKQKRIKCDEILPSCHYCASRSLDCTYPTLKPKSPSSNHGTATTNRQPPNSLELFPPSLSTLLASSPVASTSLISTPLAATSPLAFSPDRPATGVKWTSSDLELLHFYTTSTSLTFSSLFERRHVWQHVIPQIAFSNDFLLHGILALTALHLSRVLPERKNSLLAIASSHHAIALPMFSSAINSINSLNREACSVFGMIVAIYEWVSVEYTSNLFFANADNSPETSTLEWVQILRGSANVVQYNYEQMILGPLEPILRWNSAAEHEADANPAESTRFAALEQLWDPSKHSVNVAEVESLNEALRWLKIIYTVVTTPSSDNDPPSAVLSWPVRVPEHYLVMVNERQPAALILLAHFCLLLNRAEDLWWLRGISRSLLQEIHRTIDAEWETWIAWPLQDLVLCEFKNESQSGAIHR